MLYMCTTMLWTATNAFQKCPLYMASLSRKMVLRRSGSVVDDTSGNSGSSFDRNLEHRSSKLKYAAVSEKRRLKRQQQQHQKDGKSRKNTDNANVSVSRRRIHPRNAFQGSYDMDRLCAAHPNLSQFIIPASESRSGRSTIDFSNAFSVRALNAALLAADYGVHSWEEEHLPTNSLCPPVPGRADYIHYLADV
jgi:hypothetical protein